jgi:hypothetical protein
MYLHRITYFYGKINYISRTRFFIHHRTILAVKGVEIVSDKMSHIVMRVGVCDLALTVYATNANINCE